MKSSGQSSNEWLRHYFFTPLKVQEGNMSKTPKNYNIVKDEEMAMGIGEIVLEDVDSSQLCFMSLEDALSKVRTLVHTIWSSDKWQNEYVRLCD